MKFIDTAKIKVVSGKGGNGIIAWRREKYVPRGGPAGGDGGDGGSVFIEADNSLNTLLDFQYKSVFKAGDGSKGGSKNQSGKSGEDLVIKVPCGTIVKNVSTGQIIADLMLNNQRVLVAEGGKGGRGNSHFATSTRQSPHFCEPGEPEIERELELELKLIAEVGIIGLPNAGKSTLISVISAAKPKIADYPFTTLVPNLGVVQKPDGDGVVVADIPGLVEGASSGYGLGHEFMKHVERTKVLIHIIDAAGVNGSDPKQAFDVIQSEIKKYNKELADKKQILVLNKIDLLQENDLQTLKESFKKSSPVFISAAAKKNISELLNNLFGILDSLFKEEPNEVKAYFDPVATDHKKDDFVITSSSGVFYVEGKKIEGLLSVTDLRDYGSVAHLMKVLKSMGVFVELVNLGAKQGDRVFVADVEFEFSPETMIMT